MSVNGLTLDQLTYQQRETIKGLRAVGGTGKRRSIYEQSTIKDIRQVSHALTRLEVFGFVEMDTDQSWSITDAGQSLFDETTQSVGETIVGTDEAITSEPQSLEAPAILEPESQSCEASAIPEPEALSEPSEPEALSTQEAMQAEIQRWRERMKPNFSTHDAAWLCQSLASEFHDMPSVAMLLGQMAGYWEQRNNDNLRRT